MSDRVWKTLRQEMIGGSDCDVSQRILIKSGRCCCVDVYKRQAVPRRSENIKRTFREAMSPLVASTRFQCNITQCTFEGINSGSGFIERCSSYPHCPYIRIMPSLDVVEAVSYTHLDVYKRQGTNSVVPVC